jgi:alkyl sulfatase BDS1-like metallo-beta-lactamase superfamily hydrolase
MRKVLLITVVLLIAAAGTWVFMGRNLRQTVSVRPLSEKAAKSLVEHSEIFNKGVVKVTDDVYSAIGYGLANSIMIEGSDGLIIVDTMSSVEQGKTVLEAFRKISKKPIRAIIYTHNHADHVFGAEAFMIDHPQVYAQDETLPLVLRVVNEMRPTLTVRANRMFGNMLAPADVVNDGIGPFLGLTPESTFGFVPPTNTFSDVLELTVADVHMKLIHAPGETDDQSVVWLPEKRVLICGDDFYWAFPNLYTIRGTPFRSLKKWYRSLDMMRDLQPEHLVPCHTRPVTGNQKIERILTDYRDAIQFVHDQAIRGMNMGLTPDELVDYVKLPPHLAEAPYLQPFYGKVSWSVRAMFSGNIGWFDGDSATLEPLSRLDRAELMARLAGGVDKVKALTEKLAVEKKWQAVLEMTSHLLQLEPESQQVKNLRVNALSELAAVEENPNARHYYLTEAMELQKGIVVRMEYRLTPESLASLPLTSIIEAMAVNLDPQISANVDEAVGLVFPGPNEAYTIHVRRGVAEVRRRDPAQLGSMKLDIKAVLDVQLFKEMLAGLRSPLLTIPRFEFNPGNSVAFARFMKMFAPPAIKMPVMPLRDAPQPKLSPK